MKIIIVGDGKVGATLTEQLSKEGHDLTVIDRRPQALQSLQETYDVRCVCGNGAAMGALEEAGAGEADLLIAATSADEINLLCCITASKMGSASTIARVRNTDYAQQLDLLKDELGLSMTINPERTAAREIYHILRAPSSVNRDFFAGGKVELVELHIPQNSAIVGQPLSKLYKKSGAKVLICAVTRGDEVVIPSGDFVVAAGDNVHVTAQPQDMAVLLRYLGIKTPRIQAVTILGGSRIAYYLATRLMSTGVRVKIIEKEYETCRHLSQLLPGALIIHGDATQKVLLDEEGLRDADALVSLMNFDETNAIVSMYAMQQGLPKVIAKIDRIDYMNIFKKMDVQTFISPKRLICNHVLRYVRAMTASSGSSFNTMYQLVGGRVEALEFTASPATKYLNVPFKDAPVRSGVLIACILRRQKVIIATGNDCIQDGDTVILVTTSEMQVSDLNDIFQ